MDQVKYSLARPYSDYIICVKIVTYITYDDSSYRPCAIQVQEIRHLVSSSRTTQCD